MSKKVISVEEARRLGSDWAYLYHTTLGLKEMDTDEIVELYEKLGYDEDSAFLVAMRAGLEFNRLAFDEEVKKAKQLLEEAKQTVHKYG